MAICPITRSACTGSMCGFHSNLAEGCAIKNSYRNTLDLLDRLDKLDKKLDLLEHKLTNINNKVTNR